MQSISSKHNIFFQLLTIVWIIISYVPYAGYFSPTIINMPVIVGLALFLFITQSDTIFKSLLKLFPFFLFFILDYLTDAFNNEASYSFVTFAYVFLQRLLLPLVAISIISKNDYRFAKTFLVSVLVCFLLTSITTYIGCTLYPGASRALAGSLGAQGDTELLAFYNSMNIGGFEFVYTLVLFCPILIFLIKEHKLRTYHKLLFIALLIWALVVIVQTEYTTAVMVSFLSLMLFLMKANKKNYIILLIILGLLIFVASDLLMFLSTVVSSETLSNRMEDISQVIQGLDTSSSAGHTDIDSRKDLYQLAWSAFTESPIWGTGRTVGGHSFLLNILSRYGLIGLCLMIYQFTQIYMYSIKTQSKSPAYNFVFFIFLMQLILAVLNPLAIYSFFMVIIPLFCYAISYKRDNQLNHIR